MDNLPNEILWMILKIDIIMDLKKRYPNFDPDSFFQYNIGIMTELGYKQANRIHELSQVCKKFRYVLKKQTIFLDCGPLFALKEF